MLLGLLMIYIARDRTWSAKRRGNRGLPTVAPCSTTSTGGSPAGELGPTAFVASPLANLGGTTLKLRPAKLLVDLAVPG